MRAGVFLCPKLIRLQNFGFKIAGCWRMSVRPEVEMKTKNSISDDIQKEIALRAYYIWEREGRPEGREAAHWALAEAEVLCERPAKAAPPKAPAKAKSNGGAKPVKAEPAKPAKPAEPVKAAVAVKSVKAKKTVKAKKPSPKA
jgi:phosphoenolpyruvate synthase/pyruvate phosphate dikinase